VAQLSFCAVDLGAESGRVIVGNFDGQKISLDVAHRFPNTPAFVPNGCGGTLHWDILRLWNDIQDGLRIAGRSSSNIAGIGVDTWGVDFGLLDEKDSLIGNPVHYRDERHAGYIDKAAETVSKAEIYSRTGLQFLPFNTLYQLLALKDKDPRQLEIAKTLLFTPDLLNFFLSGEKKNEYSIASTSQMLNAAGRCYDEDLLRAFDLPTSILCEIASPGSKIGDLRPEIAKRLGLSSTIPILAPASHDTGSAIAAAPLESGVKSAYLSSGTWSLMGLELNEPLISERTRELGFTNEGGFGGTIRFLKNIAGLWLVQECRRAYLREGKEFSYAQLTQSASESPDDGAFVEPDDTRFAAPLDMRVAIADYCRETNQRVPQSEGDFVRCCLDSLALKYRWTFEKLEELSGNSLDVLHIVGGGTQNEFLSQITADCLQKPVITGPVEATAAGNCLIQATALGHIKDLAEIREVVKASFDTKLFEPNPTKKALWDEKFERFLNLRR
jgi:rhamnulokinase